MEYGDNKDHVEAPKESRRPKVGLDSYIWDDVGKKGNLGHQMDSKEDWNGY